MRFFSLRCPKGPAELKIYRSLSEYYIRKDGRLVLAKLKQNCTRRRQMKAGIYLRIITSWPIRRKLALLLSIIFLPAFGIIVTSGLLHRSHEIENAKNDSLLLVESLAAQQEQIAASTKVMLGTLAQYHEVRSLDSEGCNALFTEMNNRYPFYSVIMAVTPDGEAFAASIPFKSGGVNLSDRKHVSDVVKTLDFSTGEYITGRVSNKISINFGYPVFDSNKKLVAILIAGFNLSEYERFILNVHLPVHSAVVITDYKGIRLYRYPISENAVLGMPLTDKTFKHVSGNSERGIFESMNSEGIRKVYAFKQIKLKSDSSPYLYILVGLSKDRIFHEANVQLFWNLSILGIAALIAFFVAWMFGNLAFVRPIKRLVTTAREFGEGALDVRSCLPHTPDEIGVLAESFDEMASLVETRSDERRMAEEALRESEEHYRSLFDNMLNGFAYCRMLFEQGAPADFIYLNVNSAFETLTGLKNVSGKKVSEVIPGIRESDPDLFETFGRVALSGAPERFDTFIRPLESWFSISVYSQKKGCFATVFEVITERKKAEEEIHRLNRLYDVLSQVNQAIVHIRSREELLSTVCRLIVERGAIDLAWIGWLNTETLSIDPVAHFGDQSEMIGRMHHTGDDRPQGQGNPGKAIMGGRPFVCNECGRNSCLYPSELMPVRFGFNSCGSFPLRTGGEVRGALSLCVAERGFFQEREIELMEEVAFDLSFALDKIGGDIQREQLKEQYQQQSMFLETLIDAMPYQVLYKDTQLRYLGCNKAFERATEFDKNQIIGRTVYEIRPGELADLHHRADLQLLADSDGNGMVYDEIQEGADGAREYSQINKAVFRNQDGTIGGIICASVDITGLKRAEQAMRDSEERLSLALSASQMGVWEWNVKTGNIFWSPECHEIFGVKDFSGKFDHFTNLIYYEDLPDVRGKITQAIETSAIYQDQFRIVKSGGDVRWVSVLGQAVCGELSSPQRLIGVIQDITERKAVETAIKESEAKFRSYIENSPLAVLVANREGRILDFNRAALNLFQFDAGTLAEMNLSSIHPEEDRDIFIQDFARLLDKGHVEVERRIRRADGQILWVALQVVMISHQLSLGYWQDITTRKEAEAERNIIEKQLRQAQKMEALGTLAGGIAHDFNNMLGIIMGYTEMAKWEVGNGSPVVGKLEEVLKASNRAKELVKQILAFSRRSEQQKIQLQIGTIIKEAMKILRPSLPSTIEIRTDVRSKSTVLADPTQMHQVLMNLCTNAAHAMQDKGGVLEVKLADTELGPERAASSEGLEPGRYVELSVKDSGHGIDPSIIDLIFDPFFTTKGLGEGTGLGLAVVHGIVKSCAGAIDVRSTPGEGTTFTVLFPVVEADCRTVTVETANSLPHGHERVLVVDDEPVFAELVQQMLIRLGYDAVFRTAGEEGLEAFRRQPAEKAFDLIITDVTMPHFTGLDLAREVSSLQLNVPLILMTGFSRKADAKELDGLGIHGFLMKPVTIGELARTVRMVLDRRGMEEAVIYQ
jgi:PAS domain S-box-containing protein